MMALLRRALACAALAGSAASAARTPPPGLLPGGALERVALPHTWPGGTPPAPAPPPAPPAPPSPAGSCSAAQAWPDCAARCHAPLPHGDKSTCGAPQCRAVGCCWAKSSNHPWCFSPNASVAVVPPLGATAASDDGVALDWGAHRVTVTLSAAVATETPAPSSAPLALVELHWRRRDVHPQTKDVRVAFRRTANDTAPVDVAQRVVLSINGSVGRILLDGSHGTGLYDVYYLPFISNGASFGRKDSYQPMRRNGSSSAAWLSGVVAAGWKLDEASDGENSAAFVATHTSLKAVATPTYEAQTAHDLFTNMEVAATEAELSALYSAHAHRQPALLLPYDNQNVVRTFAFISTKYLNYEAGAPVWTLPSPIKLSGSPGQYLVWQLAIAEVYRGGRWPNVTNIRLEYSDLSGSGGRSIPTANLTCFNIDGVDQSGDAFTMQPHINTTLGSILPLWLGIDIGMDAAAGSYSGTVRVTADVDGKADAFRASQNYSVSVEGMALSDRGDHNASLLSRVRWLNSRFGNDNVEGDNYELPEPFTAVKRQGSTLTLFNKQIKVDSSGLLAAISVTSPPYGSRNVLHAPMAVAVPGLTAASPSLAFNRATPAQAQWTSSATLGKDVSVSVNGTTHFDGYTEFVVTAQLATSTTALLDDAQPVAALPDLRVQIPLAPSACRWMMKGGGTGAAIGNASDFDYHWTAGHPDNLFFIGSVQAGVRLRLRGPEFSWMQPRGPYHYADLPSTNESLPKFWHNGGKGGVSFRTASADGSCMLTAFTGALTLGAEPVSLHFDLVVTPNKPAPTQAERKKQRYYQMESQLVPSDTLLSEGVNIANVHQGNPYNPWIIYPLDPVANAAAKAFAGQMHKVRRKRVFVRHFHTNNDHFAKTGSGQA